MHTENIGWKRGACRFEIEVFVLTQFQPQLLVFGYRKLMSGGKGESVMVAKEQPKLLSRGRQTRSVQPSGYSGRSAEVRKLSMAVRSTFTMNLRVLALLPSISLILLVQPGSYAGSAGADAPVRANFSGRWRMNKEKTDFAKFKTPDMIVRVIDHHDPTMNVHTVQTTGVNTSSSDVSYFTDGSTSKNVINGRDATSRTYWDGSALVVKTDMKTAKNEDEEIEDRYELSEDGATLTTTSHVVTSKGDITMKLVSDKEKVGG
jgi:hypothetical protein